MTQFVVQLTDEVREQLEQIAREKGIPLEQVLADALNLEVTAAQIKADGGRILVEKEGRVRELLTSA